MEVLAALLLVVIVLPVIMGGLSTATQIGSLTRFRAEAVGLAESKLAEVIATGDWEYGDASGVFEPEQWGEDVSRYTWELTVSDWQDTTVSEVRVDVIWEQRYEEQRISLVTLVGSEDL